ncbi:MAG TPA: ceramide glucosyltransferase, partial [Rhodopila sp.]|nr:ceramide glucosyltransferase [Rhodopila sp.]
MISLLAVPVACGVIQSLAASLLVARWVRRPVQAATARPAITVLKPLYGTEPLLEEALVTLCQQDYPDWQIVFGVQDPADPAVALVERLRTRFPNVDMSLIVNRARHGT